MEGKSLMAWIIIGLIAGWLGGKLMRGGGFGLIGNLVVGVIGAFVGGWVFGLLG
ncbi:MAG: GlsB/YeaQ/YmgE family stress response membrane protein, partial [Betaproteobacteria bacterium]